MEDTMKRTMMIGAAVLVLSVAGAGAIVAQGMGERMMRGGGAMMDFDAFDADGDGRVTAEELEAHGAARFAEIDADGDGRVTREEFMAHAGARATERAGTMFDRLDADGDGVLGRDAMEARRGGFDAARMIGRLDADGDGAVTREEWEAAGARMRARMEDGARGQGRGHGHGHGAGGRNDG
jgi:hypothetical protein